MYIRLVLHKKLPPTSSQHTADTHAHYSLFKSIKKLVRNSCKLINSNQKGTIKNQKLQKVTNSVFVFSLRTTELC